MCVEQGGVMEVALSGRGQMTYLGQELPLAGTGGRGKLYRLTIK